MSVTSGHKNSSYGSFFNSTIGGDFFHCPFLTDLFKLHFVGFLYQKHTGAHGDGSVCSAHGTVPCAPNQQFRLITDKLTPVSLLICLKDMPSSMNFLKYPACSFSLTL